MRLKKFEFSREGMAGIIPLGSPLHVYILRSSKYNFLKRFISCDSFHL